MAEKIRTDERVSVIERTNLRHLPGLPQRVDLVTLDLSFISILLVSFQTLVKLPLVLWVISIFVLFSVRGHPRGFTVHLTRNVLYVLSPKENKVLFF